MTWLTSFYRNVLCGPEMNGNHIVYIGKLTFEIRARTVRHIIEHEGTPALTNAKPSSSKQSHYKPTCSSTDIYHNCVEPTIFVGKDNLRQNFSFLTHHVIYDDVARRGHRSDAIWTTRSASHKLVHAHSWPEVAVRAILATKIMWWHGNTDCDCSRFKL